MNVETQIRKAIKNIPKECKIDCILLNYYEYKGIDEIDGIKVIPSIYLEQNTFIIKMV